MLSNVNHNIYKHYIMYIHYGREETNIKSPKK